MNIYTKTKMKFMRTVTLDINRQQPRHMIKKKKNAQTKRHVQNTWETKDTNMTTKTKRKNDKLEQKLKIHKKSET